MQSTSFGAPAGSALGETSFGGLQASRGGMSAADATAVLGCEGFGVDP
jgi:hypothetical protein